MALSGIVSSPGARVTWTVRIAETAGGAEAEIFRAVTYDVTGINVAAPHAGTLFYRICLANTKTSRLSFFHVFAVPRPGGANGGSNLGPTTSVLGPNGTVCGELITTSRRLTATSNVAVTWFVRVFNGDLSLLRSIRPLTVTTTSVDQIIGPGAYAFLDVCAINHSTTQTAALSMQFTDKPVSEAFTPRIPTRSIPDATRSTTPTGSATTGSCSTLSQDGDGSLGLLTLGVESA